MLRTADKSLQLGRPLDLVVPRYEPMTATTEGEVLASSSGTLITPGGVANTKTAWVELVASTAAQADGFIFNIQTGDVGINDCLVDIGIGGAGSETVLVANILYSSGTGDSLPEKALCPVRIPPGTRISARASSTDTTAVSVRPTITLVAGGMMRSLSRRVATTYGATESGATTGTAVNAGASTHTKGAWSQISASVTHSFDSCLVCFGQRNNPTQTAQNILLDIGVGAAASEVVVWPDIYIRVRADEDIGPKAMWLPLSVKAGQRLAARMQSSTNDATDRIIDIVVIGFS
jgi:hypothetical protein